VQISPHVAVNAGNKYTNSLKKAWQHEINMMGHQPHGSVEEYRYWRSLCALNLPLCHGRLLYALGMAPGGTPNYNLFNNNAMVVEAEGSGSSTQVTIYRGTNRMAENAIFDETGKVMSDAAQRGYYESGGSVDEAAKAGKEAHAKDLAEWDGENDLAQAHSEFGTDMREFGPKSTMSWTTDPEVAKSFANGGRIYRATIDPSEGIWQSLPTSTESEVLVPNMIGAEIWVAP
jgi:hypothetical protein